MTPSPPPSTPPATEAEVRHFVKRLRLEVGVTNLAGGAVLVVGSVLFDPPAPQDTGDVAGGLFALLVVVVVWLAGLWGSHRLVAPLAEWLRGGEAGVPAPPTVQRRVLAHPGLQALMLLALWTTAAFSLAVIDALVDVEDRTREFVRTLAGIGVAGVVVSTLSFLADQRILGPWYSRFFAGEDPTRLDVPSTRVRRRLLVMFSLGTAVPLAIIGGVVTERLNTPGGVGQLEAIVWFLVTVSLAASLYLTLAIRQSIIRPLELIQTAADRVRLGDLSVAVPVESADEFGELAMAFNAMVDGLRERQRVEDLFGRNVGPAVAERLLASEGVTMGGERRIASVLFLDLAGFTTLTEERRPEEVVELLNRVFSVAVAEVDQRGGFVNKFLGDAALAIFGAPLDDPDHAVHAVEAAKAIGKHLDRLDVPYGIGLSTGRVLAGNVGAAERFEYTVIGDAVNEAERLQELTRTRGVAILISGATVGALSDPSGLVAVGREHLRGRSAATEVYGVTTSA
ncbi:MAG TPA: adenylate/guanylate cyclase domain-containing protein [Acidimicrobiia bacterium]|nr:adenylate/guanylate cyclase domain-containing protein [Acidimicrobiia bacterium]